MRINKNNTTLANGDFILNVAPNIGLMSFDWCQYSTKVNYWLLVSSPPHSTTVKPFLTVLVSC